MKKNEFQCEECKGIFVKAWTDKEAREEAKQWGDELKKQGEATICEDCYKKFMVCAAEKGWLKN